MSGKKIPFDVCITRLVSESHLEALQNLNKDLKVFC